MRLALARGHRRLAILEFGEARTIIELAAREKIDNSHMRRMLNLTTLAPDIVAAILAGKQPASLTLKDLMAPFPVDWAGQKRHFLEPDRQTRLP